ncbi:MAG: 30S ribosomal protein S8 [Phycisphaerae bacterium]|jgi:small subunit ribosomal protein S8|nr:30S ribosomal protein S8 [Phycisphaerae bacterium]
MSLSDPIADMLTRIRNGMMANAKAINVKRTKVCVNIAKVLKDEGYIEDFDVIDDQKQGLLRLKLRYGPNGERVIQKIQRESKPGCRVYRGVGELPRVLDGLGVAIVSTSRGVMSDRQAREMNIGGELICTIY